MSRISYYFYLYFLGFNLTAIIATALPHAVPSSTSTLVNYNHLFEKDSCICNYDPEDSTTWDNCVNRCTEPEKRVYFSSRDLTHLTRDICYCPFNQTSCDCGPPRQRPPKKCCGTIEPPIRLLERDIESNTVPVLHARACPPNQEQVCYEYRGIRYCVPCIQESIICPLQEEQIVCLNDVDNIVRCPPCRPPKPPICPQCVSHRNGTIVCPMLCPTEPVFCPMYCIDYPNGTVVCPGCGDKPPRTYTAELPTLTTS